jgi:hypothetical protein
MLTERGPDVEEAFDDAAFLCQERRQYNTRTRWIKRGLSNRMLTKGTDCQTSLTPRPLF